TIWHLSSSMFVPVYMVQVIPEIVLYAKLPYQEKKQSSLYKPHIYVYQDRDIIEANIPSALTYEITMEEITTHDKSGNAAPNGQRVLPNGGIISDRKAYLQANMPRDNTKSVNGEIVGDRNAIQ
nr:hypothetical protein [Tanacetum cinerariifolium]GFB08179.1 hypothetical protein [Tanacetum cinerariifolium]